VRLYRDFPDVFDPAYQTAAVRFAQQLERVKDDPYLIGYFLQNEPTWAFGDNNLAFEMFATNTPSFTKKEIKYLIQEHTSTPTLKALLKIRKPDIPIRPVINHTNAPSYKMAKKVNNILKKRLLLHNQYTTSNSRNLTNDLVKLKINNRYKS
jgi:hypothetical protein